MLAEGTVIEAQSSKTYEIVKRIGNGAFGTVYRVQIKNNKNEENTQHSRDGQFEE